MTETEFQLIKSIGFVAALGISSGLQAWRAHCGAPGSWRVNGVLWALNAALLGAVCAGCACVVSRWASSADIGLVNVAPISGGWAIVLTIVALDAVAYGWHRANHQVGLLWRFHQVHHSDPTFTASTALRFHPGELLLALPVRLGAVVALGLPVEGLIVFEIWFALSNFFEHGDINLPLGLESWLSLAFVTPALHRRHHARKRSFLNSNYATIFSVWDRLFRTFGPSDSKARVKIGLPGLPENLGALAVLAMPGRGLYRGESE